MYVIGSRLELLYTICNNVYLCLRILPLGEGIIPAGQHWAPIFLSWTTVNASKAMLVAEAAMHLSLVALHALNCDPNVLKEAWESHYSDDGEKLNDNHTCTPPRHAPRAWLVNTHNGMTCHVIPRVYCRLTSMYISASTLRTYQHSQCMCHFWFTDWVAGGLPSIQCLGY